MPLPEKELPMPEIKAREDVFLIVLAEMIDSSLQRIQEQCPCLTAYVGQGEALGR